MCFGKDLFLNRRTKQKGYIDIKKGRGLSQTQLKDLVHVVHWVKCRYKFLSKDIADFLGIPERLVKECLKKKSISCLSCSKDIKRLVINIQEKEEIIC